MQEEDQDFYTRFKEKLDLSQTFPGNYVYKFIIPNDNHKVAQIQQVFDKANPQFAYKESRTGKYASITVTLYVLDSDAVIHYYKEVGKIEGVYML